VAKDKTSTPKTTAKKATESKRRTAKSTQPKESAGQTEVVMDRRRQNRRGSEAAMATEVAEKPPMERREKVNRRRQIDPTTCERDYSNEEIEFMQALDAYKRANGRMFPTCSEILEVVRDLGYRRGPVEDQIDEELLVTVNGPDDVSVPAITDEVVAMDA
jgi:hypothetical protein